jgi:hypothetical protein
MAIKHGIIKTTSATWDENQLQVTAGIEFKMQQPQGTTPELQILQAKKELEDELPLWSEYPSDAAIQWKNAQGTDVTDSIKLMNYSIDNIASDTGIVLGHLIYGYDNQTQIEIRGSTYDMTTMRDKDNSPIWVAFHTSGEDPTLWNVITQKFKFEQHCRVHETTVKIPTFSLIVSRVYDNRDDSFLYDPPGFVPPVGCPAPPYTNVFQPIPVIVGSVNKDNFLQYPAGYFLCTELDPKKVGSKRWRFTTIFTYNQFGWDPILFYRLQDGSIMLNDDTAYRHYLANPIGYYTPEAGGATPTNVVAASQSLPNGLARPHIYPTADFSVWCQAAKYDLTELHQ